MSENVTENLFVSSAHLPFLVLPEYILFLSMFIYLTMCLFVFLLLWLVYVLVLMSGSELFNSGLFTSSISPGFQSLLLVSFYCFYHFFSMSLMCVLGSRTNW